MSNKKVSSFKKSAKRAMALLMVVLLAAGSISVLGIGATDYQPDNSDNVYIDTYEVLDAPDYDVEYSYEYEYDASYESDEVDYGYEEIKAEEVVMLYQEAIMMQPAFLMPTPFSNMLVPGHVIPAHAWSWGDFQDAVANAILGGESYLYVILASTLTADSAITIPAGLTVFLQGNGHSIFQDTAGQRHFIVNGYMHLENVTLTRNLLPSDTTISGGVLVDGGGASLYMWDDSVISNNRAANGGGVDVANTANFQMNGGTIEGNFANSNGGGVRVGGAGTTFTMAGGTIQHNQTLTPAASLGAGVALVGGSTATMLSGALITNNISARHGGGVAAVGGSTFNMDGGLIYYNTANSGGGGMHTQSSSHIIMRNDATVDNNFAGANGSSGGGFYITGASTLTMHNGIISNNISHPHIGGGMTIMGGSSFLMEDGLIYNNTSTSHGGGIAGAGANVTITIEGGHIYSNQTLNGRGGGIRVDNTATLIMTGGVVEDNTAHTNGGGIVVETGANFVMSGTAHIYDNRATSNGGGVWVSGAAAITPSNPEGITMRMLGGTIGHTNPALGNTANHGGGVNLEGGATFTMRMPASGEAGYGNASHLPPTITNNITRAGATSRHGGGVRVAGNGTTFYMHAGVIENNTSHTGTGGGVAIIEEGRFEMFEDAIVRNNNAGNNGGGVRVSDVGSTFIMHDGLIYGNRSSSDVDGASTTAGFYGGGVNIVSGASMIMHDGAIENNQATRGSGVRVGSGSLFTMNGGYIQNNTASNNGGGVHVADVVVSGDAITPSTFNMAGGTIRDNTVLYTGTTTTIGNGGGVWVGNGASFEMEDGLIDNNTANGHRGGGVYVEGFNAAAERGSSFVMHDGQISRNRALALGIAANLQSPGGGGVSVIGVAALYAPTFIMHGGIIGGDSKEYANHARHGGGVMLNSNTIFEMLGGYISHNYAIEYGSGIEGVGGGLRVDTQNVLAIIDGGTIAHNTAGTHGGGVSVWGANGDNPGRLVLRDALIYDNTANNNGGGIRIDAGGVVEMHDGAIIRDNETLATNGNGGGVWVSGTRTVTTPEGTQVVASTFEMFGGVIEDNTAGGNAGGVQVGGGGESTNPLFIMHNGTIENNTATANGGGVHVGNRATEDPVFVMHNGYIIGNQTLVNAGGGVHIGGGTFEMFNGTIDDNTSNSTGGGVVANGSGSVFIMHDGYITNNRSITAYTGINPVFGGGGVRVANIARFEMLGGLIAYNESNGAGGGVSISMGLTYNPLNAPTMIMSGGVIRDNQAETAGGGIFAGSLATVEIFGDSEIRDNTALSNGGAIAVVTTNPTVSVTIADTVISGNTGFDGGGVGVLNALGVDGEIDRAMTFDEIDAGLNIVTIAPSVTIIGNTATNGLGVSNELQANNLQIEPGTTSAPHSVNNHNVHSIPVLFTVTVVNSHASPTGAGSYAADTVVTIHAGTRSGYTFTGWTVDGTDAVLASATNATTTFTMPARNVTVTANWQPINDNGGNGGDPTPNPAVQITKSVAASVQPNAPLTYTITVRNTGNVNLTGLVVTDNLPEALQNPRDLQYPASVAASFTGQALNAIITSLSPGQAVTISFVVTVNATAGQTITNTATVNVPSMSGVSDQDSATTTVTDQQPEMIKNPDRTVVRVGETIDWTLRGFHNRSGNAVSNFTIVDIPGRGLNFQSGRLPAFTGGAGITYEIRYRVAGSGEWHTYATGIDASQPFNFSLPQPGDLYYTEIGFFFGTVPADFALNNEIVLTFMVGADAPNNVLINQFWVRYDNLEREGSSPQQPIVVPDIPDDNGGDTPWITTPEQPGEIAPPYVPQQDPVVYEPSPPATTDTAGRINPQTGDSFNMAGMIASIAGILLSLAALFVIAKKKQRVV